MAKFFDFFTIFSLSKIYAHKKLGNFSLTYTSFANLADFFAQAPATTLTITHGYSGSGKSTYSKQIAEKIGGIQIRSDIERKRLFDHKRSKDGKRVAPPS